MLAKQPINFLAAGKGLPGVTATPPGRKSLWKIYWMIKMTNPVLETIVKTALKGVK